MAAKLTLDRFRLLWLLEGAVGKSHLRWDIYDMFVNDVFPQLSDSEREAIYTYTKRDLSWHFEGSNAGKTDHNLFLQMLARFNPANQYVVTLQDGDKGKKEVVDAYIWDNKYFTKMNRFCAPEYIIDIKKKPHKLCCNKLCKKHMECLRYRNKLEDEEFGAYLMSQQFACKDCDLKIEKIEERIEENNDTTKGK